MKSVRPFTGKINTRTLLSFGIFVCSVLLPLRVLIAQVMQSSTYQITSDSVNVGGLNSSSTGYGLEDTAGEVGTGYSNSTNYYMHAGYQQMQNSFITISSPPDLSLGNISGIVGEGAEGVTSWTVTTDNPTGYNVTIEASTTPAMKSTTDSFSDYTPSDADPDYDFYVDPSTSTFGFSPEGTITNARFKDNSSACNTGTGETTGKCWDGLSTTPKSIAGDTGPNNPTGSIISVRFRAESGSSHIQASGAYSATVTVTATTL